MEAMPWTVTTPLLAVPADPAPMTVAFNDEAVAWVAAKLVLAMLPAAISILRFLEPSTCN